MKQIKFLALVLTALFLLQNCIKDRGNYNYHEINELTITFVNPVGDTIPEEILVGDTLRITPTIISSLNQDESNYEYEWVSILSVTSGGSVEVREVVSTERNLVLPISLSEGNYTIRYRVTDKQTKVYFEQFAPLRVRNIYSVGWLVMNDIDGVMRLDMLIRYLDSNLYDQDVLRSSGFPEEAKRGPIKICRFADSRSPESFAVYLLTEGGTNRVSNLDFRYQPSWNIRNHFILERYCPEGFAASNMLSSSGGTAILMSGKDNEGKHNLYYYVPATLIYWADPSNSITSGRTTFNASPKFAGTNTTAFVVFDEDTKSFYKIRANSTCEVIPQSEDALFSYRNTGLELVDLLYNYVTVSGFSFIYAVMKDPKTNDFHILRTSHKLDTPMEMDTWQPIDLGAATDIDKATLFAVGGAEIDLIFYAVGGKVYAYHIKDDASYLMLDKPGEEITYMDFISTSVTGNDIMIASYNPSTKKGTLERYQIFPRPEMFKLSTEGIGSDINSDLCQFGRIVSIAYKGGN